VPSRGRSMSAVCRLSVVGCEGTSASVTRVGNHLGSRVAGGIAQILFEVRPLRPCSVVQQKTLHTIVRCVVLEINNMEIGIIVTMQGLADSQSAGTSLTPAAGRSHHPAQMQMLNRIS
jgi:hypothetical protein